MMKYDKNRNDMDERLIRKIRILLVLFLIGLVISGLTAFPLAWEVRILNQMIGPGTFMEKMFPPMTNWIARVYEALLETDKLYPFLMYGTDWLAFGHIVIGIVILGAIYNPVRNIWVIQFGIIACVLVIPTALICGQIREIPFFWRLIDCSFGVFGIIPLWLAYIFTRQLEKNNSRKGN